MEFQAGRKYDFGSVGGSTAALRVVEGLLGVVLLIVLVVIVGAVVGRSCSCVGCVCWW